MVVKRVSKSHEDLGYGRIATKQINPTCALQKAQPQPTVPSLTQEKNLSLQRRSFGECFYKLFIKLLTTQMFLSGQQLNPGSAKQGNKGLKELFEICTEYQFNLLPLILMQIMTSAKAYQLPYILYIFYNKMGRKKEANNE